MAKTVAVLGVGNILLSDDGAGVHVLKELEKCGLPQGVELLEGGTAGMDLLYLVEEVDSLIVVDSVDAGAEPGTIFKFNPNDISLIPGAHNFSLHQPGLIETMNAGRVLCKLPPQVTIFGIQPKCVDWGLDLSPELQVQIPELALLVAKEVRAWHLADD